MENTEIQAPFSLSIKIHFLFFFFFLALVDANYKFTIIDVGEYGISGVGGLLKDQF
jgi:hypothetical protein